jgi:hypothetical protein
MENAIGNVTSGEIREISSFVGLLSVGLIGVVLIMLRFCWKRFRAVCSRALAGERRELIERYQELLIAIYITAFGLGGVIAVASGFEWVEYSFLIVTYCYMGAFVLSIILLRYVWPQIKKKQGQHFHKVESNKFAIIQFSFGSCVCLLASLVLTVIALVSITYEALGMSPAPGLTIGYSLGREGLANGLPLFLESLMWLGVSYLWESRT